MRDVNKFVSTDPKVLFSVPPPVLLYSKYSLTTKNSLISTDVKEINCRIILFAWWEQEGFLYMPGIRWNINLKDLLFFDNFSFNDIDWFFFLKKKLPSSLLISDKFQSFFSLT